MFTVRGGLDGRTKLIRETKSVDGELISFDDEPQILLRAQTDRDCRFNIVIQYINKINLARQLLDSPYDYHYCPNPPPPPPRHRHHRR